MLNRLNLTYRTVGGQINAKNMRISILGILVCCLLSSSTFRADTDKVWVVKDLSSSISTLVEEYAHVTKLNIETESTDSSVGLTANSFTNFSNAYIKTTAVSAPLACPMEVSGTGTPPTCHDDTNGVLTLDISNGTPPYTVRWPDGFIGLRRDDLAIGEYMITVADPQPCQAEFLIQISGPDPLTIVTESTDVSCTGTDDGTIESLVNGGVDYNAGGGYTFLYSDVYPEAYYSFEQSTDDNVGGNDLVSINLAGTEIYGSVGPEKIYRFEFDGNTVLQYDNDAGFMRDGFTQKTILLDFALDNISRGMILFEQGDSSGNGISIWFDQDVLVFSIDGQGESNEIRIASLQVDVWYNLQIVFDAGSLTIYQNATLLNNYLLDVTAVDASADGGGFGGVVGLSNAGGRGRFHGKLDNVMFFDRALTQNELRAFDRTGIRNDLAAGTYNITVTDINGCTATDEVTIEMDSITISVDRVMHVTCSGDDDGAIDIDVSNGDGNYRYSWEGPSSYTNTTQDIAGLSGGVYNLTVEDGSGCTAFESIEVLEADPVTITLVNKDDQQCFGEADGTIDVDITGGDGNYTYEWTSGQDTEDISNLLPGSYSLEVKDDNGCSDMMSITILSAEELTAIINSQTNPSCFESSDGSIVTTISGGQTPYTIDWNAGSYTTSNISNVPAGVYDLLVTDANSCTVQLSVSLVDPMALAIVLDSIDAPSCPTFTDGQINITINGGTTPYTYNWNNDPTLNYEDITGIGVGTYNLTVTDANSCTIDTSYIVDDPESISIAIDTVIQPLCFGDSTGAIQVTVSGGTGNLTYAWDNGIGAVEDPSGLAQGTYTLTVMDENNCEASANANIVYPDAVQINLDFHSVEIYGGFVGAGVSCNGESDGAIDISAVGGDGNYNFNWAHAPATNSGSITNLAPGDYFVTVTDGNNCSSTAMYNILEPQPLGIDTAYISNYDNFGFGVSCFGDSDGQIYVSGTGGNGEHFYGWSHDTITTSGDQNLAPGFYTVTVTDGNGCSQELTNEITEPTIMEVSSTKTDISCEGAADGFIDVTVLGGVGAYYFTWDPAQPNFEDLGGLQAGTYTVTVSDGNNCTAVTSQTILEPALLAATFDSKSDVSCFGYNDGELGINVSGGNVPYDYTWSDAITSIEDRFDLIAGAYSVTISDNNGCSVVLTESLIQPDSLSVTIDLVAQPDCFGVDDGAIQITANGGNGGYIYEWDNGIGLVEDPSDLSPGIYTVTVTDSENCTAEASATIIERLEIIVTLDNVVDVDCNGNSTGQIEISATGGTGDLTFNWDSGIGVIEDPTNLDAGSYVVSVTDDNGCYTELTVLVSEPNLLEVVLDDFTDLTCFESGDGSVDITALGGVAPYTYNWDNGIGNQEDLVGLDSGLYNLTVTDFNLCETTLQVPIMQPERLTVTANGINNISCFGANDGSIFSTSTGGTLPYQYMWTGSTALTSDLSDLSPGTYTVTITDQNGCTDSFSATIAEPALLELSADGHDALCFGDSTGYIDNVMAIGGIPDYIYDYDDLEFEGIYTFEGSTDDVSGNDNNLIRTNAGGLESYSNDAESQNQSFNFDGNTKLKYDNDAGFLESAFSERTISMWIKPNRLTGIQTLYEQGNSNRGLALKLDGNSLFARVEIASQPAVNTNTVTMNLDNLWHFVVVRFDNGIFELIVDGSSSGMVTAPFTSVTAHPESSGIGGTFTADVFDSNNNNYYEGLMDEVRISTKALSDNELNNLSNRGGNRSELPAGNYILNVIDANGCRTSAEIIIDEPSAIGAVRNSSNPSCSGFLDGTADVVPSGGIAPYTYAWDNGGNTRIQSGLSAGSYTVTITDANNCDFETSITLTEPDALEASSLVNDAICFESNDGDIILTPRGGTIPYMYSWSDGSINKDLNDMPAGIYVVTITDNNNCQLIYRDTIEEAEELELVSAVTDVLCEGEANGTIFIDVAVGVSPYVFSWSHGPSTKNVTNLTEGNYVVTITDANSCTKEFSFFVDEPQDIAVDATIVNVNCNGGGDGSIIDLEVLGGVGPYSYVWSDMAIEAYWPFEEGISDFDDITGNDHEAVQIVGDPTFDSDAVERTTSVRFDGDDKIEYSVDNVFMSQAIAYRSVSLWIKPSSFLGTQTLFEEGNATRGFALRLNNNLIQASVRDGLGNETLTDNYPATSDWVHLVMVYEFGQFSLYVNGLEVGTVATGFGIIAQGTERNRGGIGGTIENDVFVDDALSAYDNFYTGLIDNVTYHNNALSQDQISDLYANNGDRSNMSARSYTIKVYDSNGCLAEAPLTITEPEAIGLTFVQSNVDCFGDSNGSIDVTTTGGVQPYRFVWEHGAFTEDISNLSAGTYNLTIVDDNDCRDSLSVTITESEELIADINFNQSYNGGFYVSCNGSSDGAITATQTGGTAPYRYEWNYAGSNTRSLIDLGAGFYEVTVTDANNCSATEHVTIVDPPLLDLSLEALSQFNGLEISCFGEDDARIESTVTGGVNPYHYTWQGQTSTDSYLENVGVGTYTLTVRDDNGCEQTENITISAPNPISVEITVESSFNGFGVSCNGSTDGEISSSVSGGTGTYTYSWSNSANTENISNVGAGTQILTVQDENGCIARDTVVLNAPPLIQFNTAASDLNDCGTNDGSINIGATGGVGTYEYRINGSPWQTEDEFRNLAPGTYDVFVRNTFGTCEEGPKTVVIDVPEAPVINNIIIVNPSVSTASDGSVIVNASGSGNSTQLQYQLRGVRPWQTSNVFTDLNQGIYTVDVSFLGQTCFSSSSLELIAGAGIVGSGQESSYCSDEINGAQLVESYFIPAPEDQILQSLNSIDCGAASISPSGPVSSYVSIGIVEDGVRIFYDQWENGYETNLAFPSQLFGVNRTQIWGDDDPSNGIPPGYTRDVLFAGGSIILDNEVVTTTRQSVTDFDGGDRIASQGNIAITRVGWAAETGTLFAGAFEVYPTDQWGTEYKLPIGENTLNDNSMFDYSGAMIMAENDNTTIDIFIDGDNTADFTHTLQRGESYLIDGGLLVGSRIVASDRVQVDLISGKPCATFESRWFTLKPVDQWSNEYYNPVSTIDSKPTKVFLYNPDDVNTISINYLTNQNIVNSISVGPGQTLDVLIPDGTGSKFYTDDPNDVFYAIAAIDAISATIDNSIGSTSGSDWGFALIPKDQLTSQITLVSFAPSHDPSLFCSDGNVIDKSAWSVVSADSEETSDFNGVKENAIDGDNSTFWLTDYIPGIGCVTGNADVVINSNGVDLANNILGVSDGLGAELYDTNDAITVDLTDIVDQNANYSITWRRDPATVSTPSLNVFESTDGISFTLHPSSPFQFDDITFFNQIIAANIDTRYIRIESQNFYNSEIDAIEYNCCCSTPETGDPMPHEIVIDLGGSTELNGFRYTPRQDGNSTGHIGDYELYVSDDGVNWGVPVSTGSFNLFSTAAKNVTTPEITTSYIRLVINSEINGNPFAAMAEFDILACASLYSETSSPVWVTADFPDNYGSSTNQIRVCVDYKGDGGVFTDINSVSFDSLYVLNPLDRAIIQEPGVIDQSGMRLWVCDGSNAILAGAYGQDPAVASGGQPALDLGTGLPNGIPFSTSKCVDLSNDYNRNGLFDECDEVFYTIIVSNTGALPITNNAISIIDNLPPEITYISSTSSYRQDGVTTPIPDDSAGSIFPLDDSGFDFPNTIFPGDSVILFFEATINNTDLGLVITNEVIISNESIELIPEVTFPVEESEDPVISGFPNDITVSCELVPDPPLINEANCTFSNLVYPAEQAAGTKDMDGEVVLSNGVSTEFQVTSDASITNFRVVDNLYPRSAGDNSPCGSSITAVQFAQLQSQSNEVYASGTSSTIEFEFSQVVENLSFNINDLDEDNYYVDAVDVKIFDQNGSEIIYDCSNYELGQFVSNAGGTLFQASDEFDGNLLIADASADGDVKFSFFDLPVRRVEIMYRNTWSTSSNSSVNSAQFNSYITSNPNAEQSIGIGQICYCIPGTNTPSIIVNRDCGSNVNIVFDETRVPGVCNDSYTLQRSWIATDHCGNSTVHNQEIVVNDNAGPILEGIPDDITVNNSDIPSPPCKGAEVNLALTGSASQSSSLTPAFGASQAIDDNTSQGNRSSITQTQNEREPWWEIDLGSVQDLGLVELWNRTDCCSERLTNFYVLVSDVPFTSNSLTNSINQVGVYSFRYDGTALVTSNIPINRSGRYLRVQLEGDNILSLAEVRIIPSSCVRALDNCSYATIDFAEVINNVDCNYFIERTWTATDNCGSSTNATQIITVESAIDLTITKDTIYNGFDISCYQADDAAITVTGVGDFPPFSYLWSNGANTSTLNDLGPGTYVVTVTDNSGCTAVDSVELVEPIELTSTINITSDFNGQQISCNGASDGVVEANGTGGVLPYTYEWSDGSNTRTVSGLSVGNYRLTVTDNNGCQSISTIEILEPAEIIISFNVDSEVSCHSENDAIISALPIGDVPFKSYFWSTGQVTQQISNVSAGTYFVTITDENDCTATNTITIGEPDSLIIDITELNSLSCFGGNDAELEVNAVGGSGTYTYSWSTSEATPIVGSLSSGIYSVTVTDDSNCEAIGNFEVIPPIQLDANTNSTNVTCNGDTDGSITVNPTGGSGGYSILWDDSNNSFNRTNLATGNYTATVVDSELCEVFVDVDILEGEPLVLDEIITPVRCIGDSNGAIDISVTGGFSPYSYLWNNGLTSEDIVSLNAGTYTVTVTDIVGCEIIDTIVLDDPLPVLANAIVQQISCYDSNNGSIELNVTGGANPYSYTWDNGATNSDRTGLAPNDYFVTITDNNNCSAVESFTITQPDSLAMTFIEIYPTCNGDLDGSIDMTIQGGVLPYDILWSNGATSEDLNNISNERYFVTVTDNNGCIAIDTIDFLEPALLIVDPEASTDYNGFAISCNGGSDGGATVTVEGGTPPYRYLWDDPANSNSQIINNLNAGTYNVTVIDVNDCEITGSVELDQPTNPLAFADTTITHLACFGDSDGSIDIEVVGGVTPYTYEWNTAQSTRSIVDLAAGIYEVTVVDDNLCELNGIFEVLSPTVLEADLGVSNQVCIARDTIISPSVSGGVSPYFYLWNDGSNNPAITVNIIADSLFKVTVTDSNNCETVDSILLSVVGCDEDCTDGIDNDGDGLIDCADDDCIPYSNIISTGSSCTFDTVYFNAENPVIGYNYVWDFGPNAIPQISTGPGPHPVVFNACGNYTIQLDVENSAGCASSDVMAFDINDLSAPSWVANPSTLNISCDDDINTLISNWLNAFGNGTISDNCDSIIVSNNYTGISLTCGSQGTASVQFVATDVCGNSSARTANINVNDNIGPDILVNAVDTIVSCDGTGNIADITNWVSNNGGATATDVCAEVTWSNNYDGTGVSLFGSCINDTLGVLQVRFTAIDECSNSSITSARFIVIDDTDPILVALAADTVVYCDNSGNLSDLSDWLNNNGGAIVNDVCTESNNHTWNNDYDGLGVPELANCNADTTNILSVNFIAEDACGNSISSSARFIIIDEASPIITQPAIDTIIECNSLTNDIDLATWLNNNGGALANDDCGGNLSWMNDYDGSPISSTCINDTTYQVLINFTVSDDCGNADFTSARFIIVDNTTPTIIQAALDTVVACDGFGNASDIDNWVDNYAGALANDNCGGAISWSSDYDGTGAPAVGVCDMDTTNRLVVNFTATDNCGNSTTTAATFSIIDTLPPVLSPSVADIVVVCDGAGNSIELQNWLDNNGGAVASDQCGSGINFVWSNDYDGSGVPAVGLCDADTTNRLQVTFTATDDCNRSISASANFIIIDTIPPTLSQIAIDTIVECDGAGNISDLDIWLNNNGGADASDQCASGNNVFTWNHDYSGGGIPALTDCLNDTTNILNVTFTAADDCGNTVQSTARFIVVDTNDPVVSVNAQDTVVFCINDGVGNELDLQNWLNNNGGAMVADACGSGVNPYTWSHNYDGSGIPALPNCSNDTTHILEVVFTATDDCENTVQTQARFLIIDESSPNITASALDTIVVCSDNSSGNTIELQSWLNNNGGAIAEDGCSDMDSFVWSNNYDGAGIPELTNCFNDTTHILTVTFTATDNCDNTAQTVARFIIIDEDGPTLISSALDTVVTCSSNDSENELALQSWLNNNGGAIIEDACNLSDGEVIWTHDYNGNGIPALGSCVNDTTHILSVIFTATDQCENTVNTEARFILIDITPPSLTIMASDTIVNCINNATGNLTELQSWLNNHGGAAAIDGCSSGATPLTWSNDYDGSGVPELVACNNDTTAILNVSFTATDNCGNTVTTNASFAVIDITNPQVDIEATPLTVECDGSGNTLELNNWLDNHGGAIVSDGLIDIPAQDQTVVCDGAGNTIAYNDWLTTNAGASASEDCGSVSWSHNASPLSDDCGATGSVTVTFTAADECGNTAMTSAIFTVEDNVAPTITVEALPQTVECDGTGNIAEYQGWLASFAGAVATDDCGDVTWSYVDAPFSDDCGATGFVSVDFIATDDCGNTSITTADFIIEDTTDPSIIIQVRRQPYLLYKIRPRP